MSIWNWLLILTNQLKSLVGNCALVLILSRHWTVLFLVELFSLPVELLYSLFELGYDLHCSLVEPAHDLSPRQAQEPSVAASPVLLTGWMSCRRAFSSE